MEGVKRTLRAEELAGDVEGLAADDNDLLAIEELLGDNGGEATKEMALAIDDDLFSNHCQLPRLCHIFLPISIVAIVGGDFISLGWWVVDIRGLGGCRDAQERDRTGSVRDSNVPLTQKKTSLPQKSEGKEERKKRLISQSISG